MASIPAQVVRRGPAGAPCWPPDDTEESVVGTNRHQTETRNLCLGINEVAYAEAGLGQALPWQALSQTMVTGFERPDSSSYTTLPDVFYARAGVREYLFLDPTGMYLPELGRGWSLQAGVYQPWRSDELGRWQSDRFPLAFAVESRQTLVYGPGGRCQLREGEITVELARKDDEIAELRRRLEERDAY